MSDQVANCSFGHPLLNQLGDPGVSEEMGMQVSQMTLLCIVLQHLLNRIHAERTTTCLAFEADEYLFHIRKQVFPFVIQVLIQSLEGQWIHEYGSGMVTFRLVNLNTSPTALDILKTDAHCFTHS